MTQFSYLAPMFLFFPVLFAPSSFLFTGDEYYDISREARALSCCLGGVGGARGLWLSLGKILGTSPGVIGERC